VLLEVSVRALPAPEVEFARREEDVTTRGTAAGAEGGPPVAVAGAELGRPIDGGPAGCGEVVALGFGETGLSQDEKKSSSSAAVSDCAEALDVLTPSTDMPLGNL